MPHKGSPWPKALLALLLIGGWILTTTLQIQTTEAYFLGTSGVTSLLHPDWAVLMQPYDLFAGNLDASMTTVALPAWIIEILTLVFVFAFERAHSAVQGNNAKLASWFRTIMWVAVGFNFLTDYLFGPATSLGGRIFFAVFMSAAVLFFGAVGPDLLEHAFKGSSSPGAAVK